MFARFIAAVCAAVAWLTIAAGESRADLDRLIAPAAPGGGWDSTARRLQPAQLAGRSRHSLVIGIVGFGMRRYDFPAAPAVIGFILGPLAEQQMRRALAISQGDFGVFVSEPLSTVCLAIAFAAVLGPALWRLGRARLATPGSGN